MGCFIKYILIVSILYVIGQLCRITCNINYYYKNMILSHIHSRPFSVRFYKSGFDIHVGNYTNIVCIFLINYVWLNHKKISTVQYLTIGKFCSLNVLNIIANGSYMHSYKERVTTFSKLKIQNLHVPTHETESKILQKSETTIGNDVWIGQGVTLLHGITIYDGAIVATNSYVVKDVDPYSIVGGNPAKHIRYRYNPETIERLLKLKWWDHPDAEQSVLDVYEINGIDAQLEYLEQKNMSWKTS